VLETILIVLLSTGILGSVWFLLPYLLRYYASQKVEKACRERRVIVLSYDDGPSAELTPHLLDLLERQNVRATFFVTGCMAQAEPSLIQRLVASGQEVGSHTQNHLHAWKASPWAVAQDIADGLRTLERLGTPTRLFRPPFGKLTIVGLVDSIVRGLRLSYWTVDSRDSWQRRPIPEVISTLAKRGGGVVLMHDFAAPATDAPLDGHASYVLALTERVIEFANAEGYKLLRLGDVMRGSAA
jgi:peptidoglycan/xylan/chitin deacetylase (PgdA/CDA1 family)